VKVTSRVQLLELLEVVEHGLDQLVDRIVRHLGRGDEGGQHAIGGVGFGLFGYRPPGMVALA
jgi:hypothetical protein